MSALPVFEFGPLDAARAEAHRVVAELKAPIFRAAYIAAAGRHFPLSTLAAESRAEALRRVAEMLKEGASGR